MGRPASIVVGVLTGLATMVAAGYVANFTAGWHGMSSFEGMSGYFVVGMAFLGLILGLAIGLGVARFIAAGAHPGFLKALGLGFAAAFALVGIVGGISRSLADIPRWQFHPRWSTVTGRHRPLEVPVVLDGGAFSH